MDDPVSPRPWRRTLMLVGLSVAVGALVALLAWRWLSPGQGDLPSAIALLQRGESTAAVIELKSLLQREPRHAEARWWLAKAYLAQGQAPAAEAEVVRAIEAGWPQARAASVLAQALVAQRREREALDRLSTLQPPDAADAAMLHTQLAMALANTGQVAAAHQRLRDALRLVPDHAPARLARARLLQVEGDRAGATNVVQEVLRREPGHALAWVQQGDLYAASPGGGASAAEAYRRALATEPGLLAAHGALVVSLLRGGDPAQARAAWQAMSKTHPGNGTTVYLGALLSLMEGQPDRARAALQQLLKAGGDTPQVLVLAGQAELQQGALAQAQAYFGKAMAAAPTQPVPRQHLAMVMLHRGQPRAALDVLQPLLAGPRRDAQSLALAARAHLQLGDFARAAAAFDQALRLDPNDAALRTDRAQALIRMGRAEAGMDELAGLAARDSGVSADLALVSQHLQRREFDRAAQAIDALSRKSADASLLDDLRGQLALARGDREGARSAFAKLQSRQPDHFGAVRHLAALDLLDGRPDAARGRFEELLRHDPTHAAALLAWAELRRRAGAPAREVAERIEQGVRAQPGSAALRVALVDALRDAGERAAALAAAQAAATAFADDAQIVERLAALQQASGDTQQALTAWRRLAAMDLPDTAQRLRAAQALRALGASAEADALVASTLAADPHSLQSQRTAIAQALSNGEHDKARDLARALQRRQPDVALGFTLEGDVESSRQNWEAAVAAYAKGLKLRDATAAAAGYRTALQRARGDADALRFEQGWLDEHPDDLAFLAFAAQRADHDDAFDLAETRWRLLIERAPGHALAHNNLAYLLSRQNKPGALPLAQRAVELAPQVPAFLDTLAIVQAQGGQLDQALKTQARALAMAPQSASIRLGLIKLQLRAGDEAGARDAFARLMQDGAGRLDPSEIAQLRSRLQPATKPAAVAAPVTLLDLQGGSERRWGMVALSAGAAGLAAAALTWLLVAAWRRPVFDVSRSVQIDSPSDAVLAALRDLRRWESWSSDDAFAPGAVRYYAQGTTATVCNWTDRQRACKGTLALVPHADASRVVVESIASLVDQERRRVLRFQVQPGPEGARGTTLTAWCHGRASFRQRLGAMWGVERRVGRTLQRDLVALKGALESAGLGAADVDAAEPRPAPT
ncbi:MAG: XrtA/PEP-CTERM system TPR-repeat protein PrsT [Rubrivivax sp.]